MTTMGRLASEDTRRRARPLRYYRLMTRVPAIILAFAAVFAVARDANGAEPEQPSSSSGTQSQSGRSPTERDTRPPAPPRPATQTPPPPTPSDTPMATICSTPEGWCPIRSFAAPGTPCECSVPPDRRLPGVARFFLYEEPVSPYLNPHRN